MDGADAAFEEAFGVGAKKSDVVKNIKKLGARAGKMSSKSIGKLTRSLATGESDNAVTTFDLISGHKIFLSRQYVENLVHGEPAYTLLHELGHTVGLGLSLYDREIAGGMDGLAVARVAAGLPRASALRAQTVSNPWNYALYAKVRGH